MYVASSLAVEATSEIIVCVLCFHFFENIFSKERPASDSPATFRLTPIHWDTALCIFSGGCASYHKSVRSENLDLEQENYKSLKVRAG